MDDIMAEVNQRANLAFSNEMEMLTFNLTDGQLYGLNVFKIIEILETPSTITKLPDAAFGVLGTISFRDHAITVIDMSMVLGLDPVDLGKISYVLVCEYSTSIQGFLISHPDRLIHKKWDDIIAPEGSVFEGSYLTAITYEAGVPIQILDVEMILGNIIGIESAISHEVLDEGKGVVKPKHQVLAVDDSKAARLLISSALTQLGVHFTIVENAEKAYAILEKSLQDPPGVCPFNIILSDIEMPIMDGFAFTRKVKQNPRLSHIYLALHSSLSNKSNEDKAKQMGANAFIPKFQPDKIATAILEQLRKAEEHLDSKP